MVRLRLYQSLYQGRRDSVSLPFQHPCPDSGSWGAARGPFTGQLLLPACPEALCSSRLVAQQRVLTQVAPRPQLGQEPERFHRAWGVGGEWGRGKPPTPSSWCWDMGKFRGGLQSCRWMCSLALCAGCYGPSCLTVAGRGPDWRSRWLTTQPHLHGCPWPQQTPGPM